MQLNTRLTRICRSVAIGLLGICFSVTSLAAAGQDQPKESEKQATATQETSCEEKPSEASGKAEPTATADQVCPLYMYMHHGSYVSYYAVLKPDCTEYVVYDGAEGLGGADCETGDGCLPITVTTAAKSMGGPGFRHHRTDPTLEAGGVCPPDREDVEPIVAEIVTGVKYIEFPKNGVSGQTVVAKIWFHRVQPAGKPAIFAGVGHEVSAGTPDRTFADGEVVVADITRGREKRVSVLVLTNKRRQEWKPYNILLLKNCDEEEDDEEETGKDR